MPDFIGFIVCGRGALILDTELGIFTFVKIKDTQARRAAVRVLRRGSMTVSEVAAIAGVSRQVVRYWCRAAGVDIGRARQLLLAKLWRRTLGER